MPRHNLATRRRTKLWLLGITAVVLLAACVATLALPVAVTPLVIQPTPVGATRSGEMTLRGVRYGRFMYMRAVAQVPAQASPGARSSSTSMGPARHARQDEIQLTGSLSNSIRAAQSMAADSAWPLWLERPGIRVFSLPLWWVRVPLIALAIACLGLFWRIFRRPTPGVCRWCGYDLGGLAADAPCPECGSQG